MDRFIDLTEDSDVDQESTTKMFQPKSKVTERRDCASSGSKRPSASSSTSNGTAAKRAKPSTDGGSRIATRPPLFRLVSTLDDGPEAGTVSLADILSGDFTEALIANYMMDVGLLLRTQPRLASVPVVLVHGFGKNS